MIFKSQKMRNSKIIFSDFKTKDYNLFKFG